MESYHFDGYHQRLLGSKGDVVIALLLSVHAVGRSRWDKLVRYRFPLYQAIESEGIDLTPQPAWDSCVSAISRL